jgi:hypothetical protein
MIEFILSILIVIFVISVLLLSFNYSKHSEKIKLIDLKLSTKVCELENSLKYNYFELKNCGLFKKEDVYASQKYG